MKGQRPAVRHVSVSKEAAGVKRAAEAFVKKATSSAKSANATLVAIGIYTPKGELTKNYRR